MITNTTISGEASYPTSGVSVEPKLVKRVIPTMLVWGSPNLIKQWEKMAISPDGGDSSDNIRQGKRFLRTVRKDLGHVDSDLKPGALWALLIKPEEKQEAYDACKGQTYD
ncbi:MAG: hypothetical protein GWP36_06395 [Bacteroidetes bacterium]|nr:hypothetical protein [Bacteroidota bacterium]